MRIHSLANLIAFPFILITGIILYYLFFEDKASWYVYIFPPVVILVIIYTFSPKINFWWHKKYPPILDKKLLMLIEQSSAFYRKLDDMQKKKFLDRLSIFVHHKSFSLMRKEKEDLPIDVRTLLAINAITLTFNKEAYFFDDYDYFIAYNHPFPSPQIQKLHSVETDHEDGTVVFNIQMLYQSMIMKTGHFNIGLMAFTDLFMHTYADTYFPEFIIDDETEAAILEISGRKYTEIITDIGFDPHEPNLIMVPLYFDYTDAFRRVLPGIYTKYQEIFSN